MSSNVYNLDLSLGFKKFHINFEEFDEPVDILFNPADLDLPKRLFDAQERIRKIFDMEMSIDTKTEDGDDVLSKSKAISEKTDEINAALCEAVDYAFGNKISDKLFVHCSPFSIIDGKPFVTQFIEKITPFVSKIINNEVDSMAKKAKQYLAKHDVKEK